MYSGKVCSQDIAMPDHLMCLVCSAASNVAGSAYPGEAQTGALVAGAGLAREAHCAYAPVWTKHGPSACIPPIPSFEEHSHA